MKTRRDKGAKLLRQVVNLAGHLKRRRDFDDSELNKLRVMACKAAASLGVRTPRVQLPREFQLNEITRWASDAIQPVAAATA